MNSEIQPADSAAPNRAEDILLLNRWLKAIAVLIGAERACIVLTDQAGARIIARHGLPHAFLASPATLNSAPYGRDETVLVEDAIARPDLHAQLGSIAFETTGFFYRRPLLVEADRVIAMLVVDRTPRPAPRARELELVDELIEAMREEIGRHYPPSDAAHSVTMQLTSDELGRWLEATPTPAALFDAELHLVGANAPLASLLPLYTSDMLGRALAELEIPARDSLNFLFSHALKSGVSTPRMEVQIDDGPERPGRRLEVMASPLRTLDGTARLVVSLNPVAGRPRQALSATQSSDQATIAFLNETLVRRRALRSRKGVSYITLRAWRQPIREHQIRALRALKRHAAAPLAEEIASEFADDIASLIGAGAFRAIVPMPCGHSGPAHCLSAAIGRALAARLDLPSVHALTLPLMAGSSHPKANAGRPPMRLVQALDGPVLLVDDVATSGRHIEEACALIRHPGVPVLALVWIGGDAEPGEAG